MDAVPIHALAAIPILMHANADTDTRIRYLMEVIYPSVIMISP